MSYLDSYLNQFEKKGQQALADSIRKTATDIGNQHLKSFDYASNQMGLLFGNIQSGKTGQMFGIACQAADMGFPYFLLLTTDNTLLQEQTYQRAERDLQDFVVCSEGDEEKFKSHGNKPAMVIVKKNSRILSAWADRFRNSNMLTGFPLFIIDDEADAASLNTNVNKKVKGKSSINRYLSEIYDVALSSIYLQVTGTPQSLLLQTQQSNWHPMFTYYFEPGRTYLGGDFFFPKDQVPGFVHFTDGNKPVETAKKAVIRHLVVSAQELLSGSKVSNCLIHPGVRQSAHEKSKNEIEDALAWWAFHHDDDEFKQAFAVEYDSMSPVKSAKEPEQKVLNKVLKILEKREYQIVVLNGASNDDSSDYETGCNFIVGGTSLGRGVTFSHLNTFYYTRTSKNPQADTMWQHSRMFGYDRDSGLISMFISEELYTLFSQINETNNSIVNQARTGQPITIAYPEGLKPTRTNVLDKSVLNILVGGSNHFPVHPVNNSVDDINQIVERFGDHDDVIPVSLKLISQILTHFEAEKSFNLEGYRNIIDSALASNSLAQGRILVRRNREITRATRALLSPNDWNKTNQWDDEFVLTLYRVVGEKEKGWDGHPLWVPNIKLPKENDFYIV